MSAGAYDLVIEQGATLALQVVWTDQNAAAINLTGYTARLTARRHYGGSVLFSLTSAAGDIVFTSPTTGTFTVNLTAVATALLPVIVGVYDLELVSGTFVARLLQGALTVSPEATT